MKNAALYRTGLRVVRSLVYLCCAMSPLAIASQTPAWIAKANNAFATDLYSSLAADGDRNLFFSPASIETALSMTYAGARGETATQMAEVLHLPADSDTVNSDLGAFLKQLNSKTNAAGKPRGYQLTVANGFWGQTGYRFLPDFVQLLRQDYRAGIQSVNFKQDAEAARQAINAWVARVTADKITNLIAPGVLKADTRLVLANAIYFKGTWAAQFDKQDTQDKPFHLSATQQKNAPMMQRWGHYGYMEGNDFQALEIPYAGNDLSMIILLPNKVEGLPQFEKRLTDSGLSEILAQLDDQEVDVTIPRFKLTAQFELGQTLQALGMKNAFSASADFSGMTGRKNLAISDVIHKAYVDVNEQGTEAAAATAVVMEAAMAVPNEPPTPVFLADHPFLFIIRDNNSGAYLFMGRVADPTGT